MPELTDIRPASRGSRGRRAYLDGQEWRVIPAEVVRDLGLRAGQEWDETELESRIRASEPTQAWERALRLLDFRDRGTGELRARLLADGYTDGVAEAVLQRADELGFLDDRRFAEGVARAATRKSRGRRRVAAELAAKGVDEELAAEVVRACCDADAEQERALGAARSLAGRCGGDARRLASRLVARGFDAPVAWRAAQQAIADADAPSDEER